jgi:hypothetical protein
MHNRGHHEVIGGTNVDALRNGSAGAKYCDFACRGRAWAEVNDAGNLPS